MNAETLLRRATGLNLSVASIERAIQQRMAQCAIGDREQYVQSLATDELAQLIELVVVPESWLFRDAEAFVVATAFVKRLALLRARPIRMLSIPCASGEEPYSMAMALHDAGLSKNDVAIDAVDLSAVAIARAQNGIYGRYAFRGKNLDFRERYFECRGDDYKIADTMREWVQFRQGNILSIDAERYARYYDVIFCRNLLIYFDAATGLAAIANLHAIMADDGMLFAGYAEVPSFCQNNFVPVPHPMAFALRKNNAGVANEPKAASALVRRRASGMAPGIARAPAPIVRPTQIPSCSGSKTGADVPNPADLLAQARRLADQGDFQAAGIKCRDCLRLAPDSADAYFILGMISERAGQAGEAEDYWRRCAYLQPDHYEALCHLALLAEQNGNREDAKTLKARATRIFQRRQPS